MKEEKMVFFFKFTKKNNIRLELCGKREIKFDFFKENILIKFFLNKKKKWEFFKQYLNHPINCSIALGKKRKDN